MQGWGVGVAAVIGLVGAGSIAVVACSSAEDCAANATCATTVSSADGGSPRPPANCDLAADPKDSPACAVEQFAVFVDGVGGNDANPGTQKAPLKTINGAMAPDKLAGRARVYVCTSGTYDERVTVAAGISLVGGFDCDTWQYENTVTRIHPSKAGIALEISASNTRIQISDLEITAQDGVLDSETSIALLASGVKADLRRLAITAGKGVQPIFVPPGLVDGAARSPVPGAADSPSPGVTCNCKFGISVGGAGGDGNAADKGGRAGGAIPAPSSPDVNHDGRGGTGSEVSASPGHPGGAGEPGKAGAVQAHDSPPGTYTDKEGWVPAASSNGDAGRPGVGGGGGGGYGTGRFGGGGGGCGGCGGYGGYGGRGGGSSIAILASSSDLALFACTITAQNAGAGGTGGGGSSGLAGALGSVGGGGLAGGGGTGGPGAGGAGGTGGTGGVSTAILEQKSHVVQDDATKLAIGKSGQGGLGGRPGSGGGELGYFAPPGAMGSTGATLDSAATIEIP